MLSACVISKPFNLLLLLLNHVSEFLKYAAKFYNCRLDVLHGRSPALNIFILAIRHDNQVTASTEIAHAGVNAWYKSCQERESEIPCKIVLQTVHSLVPYPYSVKSPTLHWYQFPCDLMMAGIKILNVGLWTVYCFYFTMTPCAMYATCMFTTTSLLCIAQLFYTMS